MRRLRHWRTTLLSCACVCACVCVWCAVWLWAWLWARLSCLWGVLKPYTLAYAARCWCAHDSSVKNAYCTFVEPRRRARTEPHTGWLCVTCVL
jgi:hypothetical protein